MPRVPGSDKAEVDIRKIEDYCLSPIHPRGRHKARVFRDALGLGRADANWLRTSLLDALGKYDAVELATDEHGVRWRVDVPLTRQGRSVVVRTIWIIHVGEDVPRFLTCWIK